MLTRTRADATQTRELPDSAALVATLRDVFGLDVPAAAELWPRLWASSTPETGASTALGRDCCQG
jgi:hypothetical protein